MDLFEKILASRGLTGHKRDAFLNPSYDAKHDPFLLPDMQKAVSRIVRAHKKQQHITIYGDYDIDGLTATALLLDAFKTFGFEKVDTFIPNRFTEGYGLTVEAIERIAETGAQLVITVDCGSLSEKEILRANELGVDVIITDHHNVAPVDPPAVAVVNPKRLLADNPNDYENYVLKEASDKNGILYPFLDLAGVGVAFKLIQALQTKLDGMADGQEKWLLDLVSLGTVCDVVSLVDENRANVFWGLSVLSKTRRPGLRALMAVAGVDPKKVTARTLGFALGPRLNAAGRLETAQHALDLLCATNGIDALNIAQQLDVLNTSRRAEQDKIFKEAIVQAEQYRNDSVLVVSSKGWNHGIIGIVAAKLLEKYGKPTFVLEEIDDGAKGSARSFGDFSVADAVRAADDIITKGGGHKLAAGVTLPTINIPEFRKRVNDFYKSQKLSHQHAHLLAQEDAVSSIEHVTEELVEKIATLEPFGNGNPEPILSTQNLRVVYRKELGVDGQHIKLGLQDLDGRRLYMIAFSAPEHFFVETGERVTAWYKPMINEWQGRRSVEGQLLRLERA